MNLFELFVKIGVDDQASKKLANLSSKLGGGLETAAKVGTAAVGAAAAGIVALTTAAVNNYAEYEQLVGGVDTLFKDASQKVQKYAADAYKNAGMSANEYMANATAFSASLISALGDDTEAAAEYANRAMVSMSDNANKMGTSLDVIVETYQSLSRGNMEMLDNLKLGYGGTKAELERLIQNAASYTDIQEKMGITVDASSMSFDNIINAIAVVQDKLGIAGATAAEAGTTIEGSINSMKSAWANLLTGLANGNADIEQLVDNLVTTIVGDGTDSNLGVIGNVLPAVKTALNGASILVREAFPEIMDIIPTVIGDNLPILAEAAVGLVQSLVDGISDNQEMLIGTIFDVVEYLVESFVTMLPQIVQLGLDLIVSLANGIAESLPELLPTIVDVVIQIVETLTNPDTLNNLVEAALAIILALSGGLVDAIPKLIKAVPVIIGNLVQTIIEAVPKLIFAAGELVWGLITGMNSPDNLLALVEGTIRMLGSIIAGIISYYKQLFEKGKEIFLSIKDGFMKFIDDPKKWGKDLIDNFISGVKEKFGALKNAVIDVGNTIRDYIGFSEPKYGPLSDFHTYAPDMMDLFIQGIQSKKEDLKGELFDLADAVSEIFNGIKESASVLLDVSSLEYELWEKTYDASNTSLYIAEKKLKSLEETLKAQSEAVKAAEEAYKNAKSETEKYQTEQRLAREQEQYDEIQKSIDAVNEELERLNDQSATDKYRKQLGMLTDQQKEQKNIVDAAIEAYNQVVSEYGEASSESLKYQKQLLQEKIAYQELTASIQEATRALAELQQKGGLTDMYSLENYAAPIGSMTRTAQAYPNNQQQMIVNNVETTVELDGAVLARNMYTYTQNEANRRGTSLVY